MARPDSASVPAVDAAASPALLASGLSKSYRSGIFRRTERAALRGVSFEVRQGEIFGYLGPNGSGKSTTLKILLGLVFADAGTFQVLGRPLHDRSWRYRVGYLPEHPYFYDYLTPTEYLGYAGQLFGMARALVRERSDALLELVGLRRSAGTPLRRFSKGMVQRLGLAQALLNDPELLILDEPMSGLDPIGRRMVRDIIQSQRERGKTVFFSTHILSDAETLCDRIGVLRGGELLAAGRLQDILKLDASHVELLVAGLTPEALAALPGGAQARHRMGERVRLQVAAGPLAALVASVEAQGGRVLSLQPVRQSLEDYFFKELGGDDAAAQMLERELNRLLAVATNTYRESIRERVLYNLAFFAILMTLSGLLLGRLSIRQDEKILKDVGLASLELFGTLIAIFVGVGLVSKEVERRSLYPLLAKPLDRREFVLGKFLGLSLTLLLNTALMTLGLFATLYLTRGSFDPGLLKAVYAIFLSLLVTVALALLFSTLASSAAFAAVCAVVAVVVGRFSDVIHNMTEVIPDAPRPLIDFLYYALPNLANFDLKARVVYGDPVPLADLLWVTGYACAYAGLALAAAMLVFERKELK